MLLANLATAALRWPNALPRLRRPGGSRPAPARPVAKAAAVNRVMPCRAWAAGAAVIHAPVQSFPGELAALARHCARARRRAVAAHPGPAESVRPRPRQTATAGLPQTSPPAWSATDAARTCAPAPPAPTSTRSPKHRGKSARYPLSVDQHRTSRARTTTYRKARQDPSRADPARPKPPASTPTKPLPPAVTVTQSPVQNQGQTRRTRPGTGPPLDQRRKTLSRGHRARYPEGCAGSHPDTTQQRQPTIHGR